MLNKSEFHIDISTTFQEILYAHFKTKIRRGNVFSFLSTQLLKHYKEHINEVELNGEESVLKEIRFYHFKTAKRILDDDELEVPETSLLRLIWALKCLISSHCKTSMLIIQSQKTAESYVDEYNTWVRSLS